MRLFNLFSLSVSHQQKKLAGHRAVLEKSEFVKDIEVSGGDGPAAALIWDHLHRWGVADGFSPHPGDDFLKVYGIAEEELDQDLIMWVFAELELRMPTSSDAAFFGPVETPRSLAAFVTYCRGLSTAS